MTPEERDRRLLAAAERLVLAHGYDRTSVAEVARAAGVSKGGFYLAFESKDELIEELVFRASLAFQATFTEAALRHPRFGTVGAMYEAMLGALDGHPLMARILRRDALLLGRYLHRPGNVFESMAGAQISRHEALVRLQEAGAVRPEVDPAVAAHVINLIAYGLVSLPPFVTAAGTPPPDEVFPFIGRMVDAVMTPRDGPTEAAKEAMRALITSGRQGLDELVAARTQRRRARR